jgi:hypothetical protein
MPLYRKRIDGDTWHWCSNCSNYPARDYDHEWHNGKGRPRSGELYNECRSKETAGTCRS